VKKELVAKKGLVSSQVSVLGASTLQVAQQPSNFSILQTQEVCVHSGPWHALSFLFVGKLNGILFDPQRYNTTGLVLHFIEAILHPKKPRSQVSKQVSSLQAFCCKINITFKISAIQLSHSERSTLSTLLLHI